MVQNTNLSTCSICGDNYLNSYHYIHDNDILRCECLRCGHFDIPNELVSIQQPPWKEVRHLVSAWVRKENQKNPTKMPIIGDGISMDKIVSPDWWANKFKHMGLPETLIDKLDALLNAYASDLGNDYKGSVDPTKPHLISDCAAKNENEVAGLTNLLNQMEYINHKEGGPRSISAKGWLHIEEIRKNITTSDTAFIALWFNDITKDYRHAVFAAVESCGYKPIILDQEEYNGFIMEQVVSQIKLARFVIADFTCRPESVENNTVKAGVRGGVYWEAGMAYGLNKPVIHTCEDNEDAISRRHFDIDQYNTIFWKLGDLNTNIRNLSEKIDNPTFAEKLANRILWVVGKGGFKE
jgi:hypothetical protein